MQDQNEKLSANTQKGYGWRHLAKSVKTERLILRLPRRGEKSERTRDKKTRGRERHHDGQKKRSTAHIQASKKKTTTTTTHVVEEKRT